MQPIYAVKIGSNGDLTLEDGKESSEAVAWSKQRGGVYLPSPIAYGDHLYTLGNNGVLTAYDWIRACKGGEPECSHFGIAGPFAEWVTLGAIA